MSATSPDQDPPDNLPNYAPEDEPTESNGGWNVSRRDDAGDWKLLGRDVAGGTRRTAVRTITQHLDDDMQWGQFLVEKDGEAKILTRSKRIVETIAEEWS